jgi:LmbE family N-acetylglucosaminyl deacetylase
MPPVLGAKQSLIWVIRTEPTVRHNGSTMRNLLFLHAHPDDEALLTAGTMAKAHAAGHRVHLVVATDGSAGLTSGDFANDLASHRSVELAQSAEILGVTSVTELKYPDSGLHGEHIADGGFAGLDPEIVAKRLADLVLELNVDTLVGYDPSGGYGHPDHVQVHKVARAVQQLTSCTLFEATLPREPIARAVKLASALSLTPTDFDPDTFTQSWTPKAQITHRVNVRKFTPLKKASIMAHSSQSSADGTIRTLAVLSKLPKPIFDALLGTEYFVKVN